MKPIWERIKETVAKRSGSYAHPSINHQVTADMWNAYLTGRASSLPEGSELALTAEDICAMNVLQKISRLAAGFHEDSWVDIAGYAENVAMLKPEQLNLAREQERFEREFGNNDTWCGPDPKPMSIAMIIDNITTRMGIDPSVPKPEIVTLVGGEKKSAPAGMPRSGARYFVDEWNGCIAVRDSKAEGYDPAEPGLTPGMAGVVWYEHGQELELTEGRSWTLWPGARERALRIMDLYEETRP